MDEAEENLDVSATVEISGTEEDPLLNLQNPDLESGADLDISAMLDTDEAENSASTADVGVALNAADEEESLADLDMDSWLAADTATVSGKDESADVAPVANGGWLTDSETLAETPLSENDRLAGDDNIIEETVGESGFEAESVEADLNASEEALITEAEEENVLPVAEDEAEQEAEKESLSEESSLVGENPLLETETPSFPEIGAEEKVSPLFETETAAADIGAAAEINDNFVNWYSGSVHDEMFEISKNDLPETICGDASRRIIHINTGYDSYGWLAEFDNGLTMSLEDVRKYQIRNGSLPGSDGVIRYGRNSCAFSGIERILIYRSVRYFSYGA